MPFYEYECPNCGYRDEVLQRISDKPLKKCPSCGKNGLKKLISAPVFRLKGSGWYETDFKSDKENKRNLHGADKEEASASKDEAKPDAKPDAKADASKAESAKPQSGEDKGAKPAADKPAAKPAKRSRATRKPGKPARKARR
jgi:putative FmdB family regulatory protein